MNVAGARLARRGRGRARPGPRFVAGSVGPLNVTLSLSPKVDDPAFRAVTFDEVRDAYAEQIRGLRRRRRRPAADRDDLRHAQREGGDRRRDCDESRRELPLWISVTVVDRSGRTLSGQTVEAFWISVAHAEPLIVGVNCSLGAREMRPYVAELARVAPTYVSCYPNAGLPNAFGGYDEQPEDDEPRCSREFAAERPRQHRRRLLRHDAGAHRGDRGRGRGVWRRATRPATARTRPRFSGLEPFTIRPGHELRDDRRAHERHRLGALPPPDQGRRLPDGASRSRSSRCAAAPTSST